MALLFPAYTSAPDLIWVRMNDTSISVDLDHPELAQLSVECGPDPWGSASSILCNDLLFMQDTKLGHALTLISPVGETTEGLEGKWLNRSVRRYAPPHHLYPWQGPLIFVSWHVDEDAQLQKLCDISMRDYHHAIKVLLEWHANPCVLNPSRFGPTIAHTIANAQEPQTAPKTKSMKKRAQRKKAQARRKLEAAQATEAKAVAAEEDAFLAATRIPLPESPVSEASQDDTAAPEDKDEHTDCSVTLDADSEVETMVQDGGAPQDMSKMRPASSELGTKILHPEPDLHEYSQHLLPEKQDNAKFGVHATEPCIHEDSKNNKGTRTEAHNCSDEERNDAGHPEPELTCNDETDTSSPGEVSSHIDHEQPGPHTEDEVHEVPSQGPTPRDLNKTCQASTIDTSCYTMSEESSFSSTIADDDNDDDDDTETSTGRQQKGPKDKKDAQLHELMILFEKRAMRRFDELTEMVNDLSRKVDVLQKGPAKEASPDEASEPLDEPAKRLPA
ncbi:hypothetical protein D7B24_004000 [Verticillium nonalfalfae]|uniref:Uncharacterized protein n=1 Tax=Verticillium nonalfalfae TaxID=1051616 RepID=A0A3M9YIJ2_9PEZI|nr:uncharacterized protein D7B24_004000 [Verticillium nonalfalfae]RNJ58910.1 hypothetical protein D7B24_004000 [Verticillium nonalfalfae]